MKEIEEVQVTEEQLGLRTGQNWGWTCQTEKPFSRRSKVASQGSTPTTAGDKHWLHLMDFYALITIIVKTISVMSDMLSRDTVIIWMWKNFNMHFICDTEN